MKVIYYQDELNDEFSEAKIVPRVIDENYSYSHRNPLWNLSSFVVQNILSMPFKIGYNKIKLHTRYIGKEKIRPYQKQGYFLYGNHTQPFADTFIPSVAIYPKRNFFIVNPENISMKGLQHLVEMLGAIPVPGNKKATKNFLEIIRKRIERGYSITIYPEAHIWPYYTKIRPFPSVSFEYPVKLETPTFCFTNTYQKYGKKQNKIQLVCYIDGPFFPDKTLTVKEAKQKLRDEIYQCMVQRSKNNTVEKIQYVKKEILNREEKNNEGN